MYTFKSIVTSDKFLTILLTSWQKRGDKEKINFLSIPVVTPSPLRSMGGPRGLWFNTENQTMLEPERSPAVPQKGALGF